MNRIVDVDIGKRRMSSHLCYSSGVFQLGFFWLYVYTSFNERHLYIVWKFFYLLSIGAFHCVFTRCGSVDAE